MNVGKKLVGKLIDLDLLNQLVFYKVCKWSNWQWVFMQNSKDWQNRYQAIILLGEACSPIYRIRILSFFIWASEENPLTIWNIFKMQKKYAQPYVYCPGRGNVHQFKSMKVLYWSPQPKWTVRCRQGTGSSTISSQLFQAECAVQCTVCMEHQIHTYFRRCALSILILKHMWRKSNWTSKTDLNWKMLWDIFGTPCISQTAPTRRAKIENLISDIS